MNITDINLINAYKNNIIAYKMKINDLKKGLIKNIKSLKEEKLKQKNR